MRKEDNFCLKYKCQIVNIPADDDERRMLLRFSKGTGFAAQILGQ